MKTPRDLPARRCVRAFGRLGFMPHPAMDQAEIARRLGPAWTITVPPLKVVGRKPKDPLLVPRAYLARAGKAAVRIIFIPARGKAMVAPVIPRWVTFAVLVPMIAVVVTAGPLLRSAGVPFGSLDAGILGGLLGGGITALVQLPRRKRMRLVADALSAPVAVAPPATTPALGFVGPRLDRTVPAPSAKQPESPGPSATPTTCPRCKNRFAIAAARPLTVKCPSCGFAGTLR